VFGFTVNYFSSGRRKPAMVPCAGEKKTPWIRPEGIPPEWVRGGLIAGPEDLRKTLCKLRAVERGGRVTRVGT